jgi:hypothetical protein
MTARHFEHLKFIISNSDEVSNYLYGKELSVTQTFCLGIIERLHHSSKTIITLLEKIEQEPSHEYSIGIITRALLLDTLTGMNLFKIFSESEALNEHKEITNEKATIFCEINLADGLSKTISYLADAKKYGFINDNQLKEAYKNTVASKSNFFEPYQNNGTIPVLKHKKYFSPRQLFEILALDENMKRTASIYDAYLYFSKYDHFGIMYYEIIRQHKTEKENIYLEAFEGLVAHLAFLIIVLFKTLDTDEFLNNKAIQANQYFSKMVGV